MFILWSILLGVGLAMDAFAVSISNSLNESLKTKKILLIAITFGIFQGVMPLIGYLCGELLEKIEWITYIIPLFGAIVLAFLGIKTIVESLKLKDEDDLEYKKLTIKLLLIQAVATSIDALTVGIGINNTISANNYIEVYVGITIIIVVTIIICLLGLLLGKFLKNSMKKNAEILGGIILLLISAKIIIEFIISLH